MFPSLVVILFIATLFFREYSAIGEFRFVCGDDVCEVPLQFCDPDENRCRYCTRDICLGTVHVPPQCEQKCTEFRNEATTVAPIVSSHGSRPTAGNQVDVGTTGKTVDSILIYIAAGVTIVILVEGIKFIWKIWKHYCGEGKQIEKPEQNVRLSEISIHSEFDGAATEKNPLLQGSEPRMESPIVIEPGQKTTVPNGYLAHIDTSLPPYTSMGQGPQQENSNAVSIDAAPSIQGQPISTTAPVERQCTEKFITNPENNRCDEKPNNDLFGIKEVDEDTDLKKS